MQRATFRRELLRARLQTLRAPFDAVVAQCLANSGEFVPAGSTLVRIVDDARFVRFAVPSAELARLQIGSTLRVALRAEDPAWVATLIELQPELDAAVSLGFGRAELASVTPQALALPPGTRVDVLAAAVSTPR